MNKRTTTIIAYGFPLILIFGMLASIIIPDKEFSAEENRVLADKPPLSLSQYLDGRFERKAEAYTSDHIPGRDFFIKIKCSTDLAMGNNYSNGVFLGHDNYLLEDIKKPDNNRIKKNIDNLKNFKKKYPDLKMSLLMAPTSANIYSEKLPFFAKVYDQNKTIDTFNKELKSAGFDIIDCRDDFNKNKDKIQLYYRTDHHWTTEGAYIAFKRLCSTLGLEDNVKYKKLIVKNDFRGTLSSKSGFTNGLNDDISIYLPNSDNYVNSLIYYFDSKKKTTEFYIPNNLKKKDAYTVFGGSNHPIYTIETPNGKKGNLLLLKDSYANSMIPFLSQCYNKIVVVDPRYFYEDIDKVIKTNNITDVMFLYNAATLSSDDSLDMM